MEKRLRGPCPSQREGKGEESRERARERAERKLGREGERVLQKESLGRRSEKAVSHFLEVKSTCGSEQVPKRDFDSASDRRGDNVKTSTDIYLKVKARIRP